MADAGVKSIENLKNFGRQISAMGAQMTNVMEQAQRRMNEVCEGWHDDMNEQFKVRFNESVVLVKKMAIEFENYHQYLERTAQILELYKQNKIKF